MVYGVEKFKEAFAAFQDCYVVIGGTACDAVLAGSRMKVRATDDIDSIRMVNANVAKTKSLYMNYTGLRIQRRDIPSR